MTASKSSGSILTRVRSRTIPALFTRMSICPKVSSAVVTIRPAASKSVTESWAGTARPPRPDDLGAHVARRVLPEVVASQAHPDVVDHHGGPLVGQGQGEFATDAPPRSGDHRHPSFQQHRVSHRRHHPGWAAGCRYYWRNHPTV